MNVVSGVGWRRKIKTVNVVERAEKYETEMRAWVECPINRMVVYADAAKNTPRTETESAKICWAGVTGSICGADESVVG